MSKYFYFSVHIKLFHIFKYLILLENGIFTKIKITKTALCNKKKFS